MESENPPARKPNTRADGTPYPQSKRLVAVKAKFEERLTKERDAIKTLDEQVKSIEAEVKGMSSDRGSFQQTKDAHHQKINELQAKLKDLLQAKDKIYQDIEKANTKDKQMKNEISSMKKSLPCTSEEEIDTKIQEINKLLMTTTGMTAKQEKEYVNKIKQLKQSKPQISKYNELSTQASTEVVPVQPMKEKLAEIKTELETLRNELNAERAKLDSLKEQWAKSNAPVTALLAKKKELLATMKEHMQKRNEVRAEMDIEVKQVIDEEKKQKIELREKLREEKLKREQEEVIEKVKADLQSEAHDMPVSRELVDVRSALTYLKKHDPSIDAEDSPKEDCKTVFLTEDGEEMVVPQKEKPYDSEHKKGKKAKGKKSSEMKARPLTHDIRTISEFAKYKITLPRSASEVPEVISQMQERINELESSHKRDLEQWTARKGTIEKKLTALERGASLKELDDIVEPAEQTQTESLNEQPTVLAQ